MPDGQSLLGLSDESGEVEFWRVPANGLGASTQLTTDGAVLRWDGLPSPDGKSIAHYDKDQQLWVLEHRHEEADQAGLRRQRRLRRPGVVARQPVPRLHGAGRQHDDAHLPLGSGERTHRAGDLGPLRQRAARRGAATASGSTSCPTATSSRWSAARGDRGSPSRSTTSRRASTTCRWCPTQRSPFQPADELHPAEKDDEKKDERTKKPEETKADEDKGRRTDEGNADEASRPTGSKSTSTNLATRLIEVPVPAGNYSSLSADAKRLYMLDRDTEPQSKRALKTLAIDANKTRSSRRSSTTCAATSCRRMGRRCWCGARRTTSCSTPPPRRRPQPSWPKKVRAVRRLALPARPARRVAPDVHRGLAPRARLLLRPADARRGLARDAREVPRRWSIASRTAPSCPTSWRRW